MILVTVKALHVEAEIAVDDIIPFEDDIIAARVVTVALRTTVVLWLLDGKFGDEEGEIKADDEDKWLFTELLDGKFDEEEEVIKADDEDILLLAEVLEFEYFD
jgi:hypothetical protein